MSLAGDAATSPGFVVELLGEDALLLRFDFNGAADEETNRHVHALASRIQARRPAWLRELVPAYASLALQVDVEALAGGHDADPLEYARRWLDALCRDQTLQSSTAAQAAEGDIIEVPVCYGGTYGPDLEAVAQHAGTSVDDVVERHAGGRYTVAMLGFAPGFPYLLGLDPALAMPRMDTPRTRVPAGSVGIGGAQTGIYPREGPGGWQLIGRTPLALFDPTRDAPSLLQPGQRVRFVAIDAAAFDKMAASAKRRRAP